MLKHRITHSFIEIKADEIEVSLFRSDKEEIKKMINNLQEIVDDLKMFLK